MPNNLSGHQIVRMSIISQEPTVEPKTEPVNPNSDQVQEEPDLQRIITDPDEEDTVISTVSLLLKLNLGNVNFYVGNRYLQALPGFLKRVKPIGSTLKWPITL